MIKTLLQKMYLKPDYAFVIINQPNELKAELHSTQEIHTSLNQKYNFILAFYSKKQELEKDIRKMKVCLLPEGLLWIAYPKSKKLEADLNRDILHGLMQEYGLDGVSLVSLNSTWSAMRFKVI